MSKRLGIATIKYDGKVLNSRPGASMDPGGIARKSVITDLNIGFSEELRQSKVECEIAYDKDTSLAELGQISGATLTFDCDTGQSYVIKDAWITDTPQLTAGDGGKVKLTFEGPAAEEMM
ncbi:MAG: phage tail tube protein [Desulfobulbaceae bacterium]|nr:phage tail tube protein [Desulfobulbaceae bacterium]